VSTRDIDLLAHGYFQGSEDCNYSAPWRQ